MTTERFHLGDVLSITTGRLVSPTHMDGIYRICTHLAGEPVWTHQLPRVANEARPHLLAQFPQLAPITGDDVTGENHATWLAARVADLGEWFDVMPMSADQHESIDSLSELAEKAHPSKILTVEV